MKASNVFGTGGTSRWEFRKDGKAPKEDQSLAEMLGGKEIKNPKWEDKVVETPQEAEEVVEEEFEILPSPELSLGALVSAVKDFLAGDITEADLQGVVDSIEGE